MSIRIREVDGRWVAICAARSVPKEGDIYLHDGAHHALSIKFDLDFDSMGLLRHSIYADSDEAKLMEHEESNNSNREDWDKRFGSHMGFLKDTL
jgi:hypothetical protein